MNILKKQVKKRKLTVVLCSILIYIVSSITVASFLYYGPILKSHSQQRMVETTIVEVYMIVLAVWIIVVFLVLWTKDDAKKVIAGLNSMQLDDFEQCSEGVNFYKNIFTMTDELLVVNANQYSLKLIPMDEIKEIHCYARFRAPRGGPIVNVIELKRKSNKNIRIAVKDAPFANQRIEYLQTAFKNYKQKQAVGFN